MQAEGSLRDVWLECLRQPASASVWDKFIGLTGPLIGRIATRTGEQWGIQGRDQISDLVQDIYLKICETRRLNLPEEERLVEAYLRVVAANAARDSLRCRYANKRGQRVTIPMDDHMDSLRAQAGLAEIDRQVLLRQVDELIDSSERDRAVFWLYFRQGLSAKEIASVAAVELTPKGVESLLHRMIATLRERISRGPAHDPSADSGRNTQPLRKSEHAG